MLEFQSLLTIFSKLLGDNSIEALTLLDILNTEYGQELFDAYDMAQDYIKRKELSIRIQL